jgi:TetR/AcrR family transcriptional repressor of nem operon
MIKTQKQLQGEQTRQQIIDTAAKLFASRGFYGTSMSDLASAAGLTKGAFYHHFENKDALFFAVIQLVREKWQRAVGVEVVQAHHALDQIMILLDSHARLLRKEPTLCLVMHGLTAEMEDTNPAFLEALQGVYTEMILFIEEIIHNGQMNQQVRNDVDARLIALNIVGLLRGVSCFGVLGEMGLDCVQVINGFKPVLVDGLRPKS